MNHISIIHTSSDSTKRSNENCILNSNSYITVGLRFYQLNLNIPSNKKKIILINVCVLTIHLLCLITINLNKDD